MAHQVEVREHERLNREYFDRWAVNYDGGRISKWFQYTQALAISVLRPQVGSRVLDVGCGTGEAVLRLGSIVQSGKACGIDISRRMIEHAWSKVSEDLRAVVEFREGSAENIPYPDQNFDGILCTNSFHHYRNPIGALKEMQRVLNPGGQIVILENAPDLSWHAWFWDRLLRIVEKGHVRYYPSRELGDLLSMSGLEDVHLCYLKNECLKFGKLFASLQIWEGRKSRRVMQSYAD